MKTKIILILAMFTVCFSCKKDVETTDPNEILEIFEGLPTNNVIGIKTIGNGKSGTFKSFGSGLISKSTKKGFFFLNVASYNVNEELRDYLTMDDLPLTKGRFPIVTSKLVENDNIIDALYARMAADGDISGAQYSLDTSKANEIEITDVDTVANYARGKLNVHFVMKGESIIPNLPQKVSFTSVNFYVLLTWK